MFRVLESGKKVVEKIKRKKDSINTCLLLTILIYNNLEMCEKAGVYGNIWSI